jgi:hypothetical protein
MGAGWGALSSGGLSAKLGSNVPSSLRATSSHFFSRDQPMMLPGGSRLGMAIETRWYQYHVDFPTTPSTVIDLPL